MSKASKKRLARMSTKTKKNKEAKEHLKKVTDAYGDLPNYLHHLKIRAINQLTGEEL